MSSIIGLVLVALAAACNALMDKVDFHWYKFRFKNKVSEKWWRKSVSWENKYKYPRIPVWFTDAWHFFKSSMIFGLVGSIVTYEGIFIIEGWWKWLGPCLDFGLYGCIWIWSFNLFFNHILEKEFK